MRLLPLVITVALALPACTFTGTSAPTVEKEASDIPAPAPVSAEPPVPEAPDDSELVERFYAAGWRYCEAQLLATFWKTETWDAKIRAGTKVTAGDADSVRQALEEVRRPMRLTRARPCSYVDIGYTYSDAEALAKAWRTTVVQAKERVEIKVSSRGDYAMIDAAIEEGRAREAQPALGPDERAYRAFLDSPDVDGCHAKMLAAAWGSTVRQAKVILGHKVVGNQTELMDEALGEARSHARANPGARCRWEDTGFTYADAEQIEKLWDMTRHEAKVALTDKYLQGSEGSVRAFLASQTPGQ